MSVLEIVALGVGAVLVGFVITEGLASLALAFRDRSAVLWAAGRKRSTHDPELGWVNKPNTYIPDLYGPGRYVRINSQGFRNNHDFASGVEEGRLRIVCSGDSFTFGEGVDNDRTWCQLLASLDPRLEPLNMGQTGYGVDQAYLWYKRDGLKFSHQVHCLQFITDDFSRIQKADFAGYAKPVLDVVNGGLVVTNVPVPRRSFYVTWLARHVKNLNHVRTVEFLNRAFWKVRSIAAHAGPTPAEEAGKKKTREILRKIFKDLKALSEQRFIQPVLLYLPTLPEITGNGSDFREWMEFLRGESKALGIPLFEVFSDFRRLPAHQVVGMYATESEMGPNHFNDAGNTFVAGVIYDKLRSLPSIAEGLNMSEWSKRA